MFAEHSGETLVDAEVDTANVAGGPALEAGIELKMAVEKVLDTGVDTADGVVERATDAEGDAPKPAIRFLPCATEDEVEEALGVGADIVATIVARAVDNIVDIAVADEADEAETAESDFAKTEAANAATSAAACPEADTAKTDTSETTIWEAAAAEDAIAFATAAAWEADTAEAATKAAVAEAATSEATTPDADTADAATAEAATPDAATAEAAIAFNTAAAPEADTAEAVSSEAATADAVASDTATADADNADAAASEADIAKDTVGGGLGCGVNTVVNVLGRALDAEVAEVEARRGDDAVERVLEDRVEEIETGGGTTFDTEADKDEEPSAASPPGGVSPGVIVT